MFYIRVIIVSVYVIVISTPMLILTLLRPFNPINSWIFAQFLGPVSKFILGLKVSIEGLEHIKNQKGAIIISNHQENLDIVPLSLIVPKNISTLGKKSILYIPIFGIFYWLSGNVLINRSKKSSALQTMKKAADFIKNKKIAIFIFPEGTRNKGKGLLPFKKGAFRTAFDTQFPIIPVCVSSYHKNINLNKFKSGTIKIKILSPIATTNLQKNDIHKLVEETQLLMENTISNLDDFT